MIILATVEVRYRISSSELWVGASEKCQYATASFAAQAFGMKLRLLKISGQGGTMN